MTIMTEFNYNVKGDLNGEENKVAFRSIKDTQDFLLRGRRTSALLWAVFWIVCLLAFAASVLGEHFERRDKLECIQSKSVEICKALLEKDEE